VEETYYWQGKVLAAQGDFQGARSAYSRALQHNPRYFAAQDALDQLNA
jgi:TolA-binding protein